MMHVVGSGVFMTRSLQAVYEKGVLRPLEPLALSEHQEVTVTVCDQEHAEGEWADVDALGRRFWADLTKTKRLTGVRLLVAHYQEAERLLRQHGPARRLRTLDALQLAVAIELRRKNAIERLVSADRELLAVAAAEGLTVLDPENL